MGWLFRKSKQKGMLRGTIGKKSASASLGVRGARITRNTKGQTTVTVGIPGTGIRYQKRLGGSRRSKAGGGEAGGVVGTLVALVIGGMFLLCGLPVALLMGLGLLASMAPAPAPLAKPSASSATPAASIAPAVPITPARGSAPVMPVEPVVEPATEPDAQPEISAAERESMREQADERERMQREQDRRLAPFRREQAAEAAKTRTWTTADGKYSIEATFLSATYGEVKLRRTDTGDVITIAMDKLSAEDRDFITHRRWDD